LSGPTTYVDSSALVKLLMRERGSRELATLLGGHRVVSSRISAVEVRRTVSRGLGAAWDDPAGLLDEVVLVELEASIMDRAAQVLPPLLCALDAIHLATALELGDDLDLFVTYDERLAEAARAAGMTVASPGVA
jgi:uncharacterized protein